MTDPTQPADDLCPCGCGKRTWQEHAVARGICPRCARPAAPSEVICEVCLNGKPIYLGHAAFSVVAGRTNVDAVREFFAKRPA